MKEMKREGIKVSKVDASRAIKGLLAQLRCNDLFVIFVIVNLLTQLAIFYFFKSAKQSHL